MDKQPYPVVTERVLAPVPPKRFFSRSFGRAPEEVPVPMVGHRLVYRTRGAHVLDTSALALDSPTVVDASHVSVVDVTNDTEVAVELAIPSRDGSCFTMRVTFLCTVRDPVAVVRTGGHDAGIMLTGYLRGHQRIFEVGLDFDLDSINDVRRKLNAQVRAYVTLSPPSFDGMVAELASVEVNTPEEVAKFRGTLREVKQDHVVKTEQLTNEQRRGDLEHIHQQTREVQTDEHVRGLDAAQRHHARQELRLTADAVATDPIAALSLAYGAGDLTAKEYAEELKRLREQEIAQDREDLRARIEYERERDRQRWEAARTDRLRSAEWEREDKQLEREATAKEIEAKLEVIRELAKHGHLDTLNLRLDKFVNDMLGDRGTPAIDSTGGGDASAITAITEDPTPVDDGGTDEGEPVEADEADRNTRVEA